MTPSPDSSSAIPTVRHTYIDWARAIAVLLMIEAHTLDAWTRPADRHGAAFRYATILGGFAAPLFLWLAGLAVVLSATRRADRTGNRRAAVEAVCRRGIEILILAFLFRLQAFIVSPGSYPVTLFRVDILNVMGPAIAAAGLIWGLARSTVGLAAAYSVVAVAVAMVTPIVRVAPQVDALPSIVQWYVRPAGDYTTFTLFPWAGFVFAGAACGAFIAAARVRRQEKRVLAWLAVAGAAIVGASFYAAALKSIYSQSSFWTSSPTYFGVRAGLLMIALSAIFVASEAADRRGIAARSLVKIGQHSLFIYWIHVELVYGYASWLWRGRLPLWGTALGCVSFSALMYGAVLCRDRVVEAWAASTLPRKELSV